MTPAQERLAIRATAILRIKREGFIKDVSDLQCIAIEGVKVVLRADNGTMVTLNYRAGPEDVGAWQVGVTYSGGFLNPAQSVE